LVVALAESIDTLVVNLAETQPMWLTAVPRFYEKVWASVEHLSPAERREKLHRLFGPRLRHLSSGGAPLPRHVCEAFFESGIPLLEGYGLTETSPVISFNGRHNVRIGTVGLPVPGVEVKIAPDGEILTRGPNVMKGYWKDPEATAQTIVDGWLCTGDVGEIDGDGYLKITDRKKDLIITSSGKNIAPSELERLLVSDPFIDQAVVYGDGRRFISALIAPDFKSLERKAAELDCAIQAREGFITTPALIDFLGERIQTLMERVSRTERVKKFLILDRPFQVDADEMTATLKVRRRHIIHKFEAQLAALYSEDCAEAEN
jgi:long-chain acyl-CoA synthetase